MVKFISVAKSYLCCQGAFCVFQVASQMPHSWLNLWVWSFLHQLWSCWLAPGSVHYMSCWNVDDHKVKGKCQHQKDWFRSLLTIHDIKLFLVRLAHPMINCGDQCWWGFCLRCVFVYVYTSQTVTMETGHQKIILVTYRRDIGWKVITKACLHLGPTFILPASTLCLYPSYYLVDQVISSDQRLCPQFETGFQSYIRQPLTQIHTEPIAVLFSRGKLLTPRCYHRWKCDEALFAGVFGENMYAAVHISVTWRNWLPQWCLLSLIFVNTDFICQKPSNKRSYW